MTLKRTGFAKPKTKECANKVCKTRLPVDSRQPWIDFCSVDCGVILGMERGLKRRKKEEQAKAKAERADVKRRKQAIKTTPELKAELQKVFNECMRLEDEIAGHGCICCGKFATPAALAQLGGAYDACHYRSRGSADHLRFNEDNVWRGLKDCNTWGHVDYRGGLIKRIGLERVEALENNNTIIKWDRSWLESQKKHYANRVKQLKKELQ